MSRLSVVGVIVLLMATSCGGGPSSASKRVHVIGVLRAVPPLKDASGADVFLDDLRQDGYDHGSNLTVLGEDETHPDAADASAAIKRWRARGAELMVAFSTTAALLITKTFPGMPVVFVVNDPVAAGLVRDENRPDGQATGVTFRVPADRTLDLARRVVGNVRLIGLLYVPSDPGSAPARDSFIGAASRLGLMVTPQPFDGASNIVAGVEALAARHVDAIVLANSPSAVRAAPAAQQEILTRHLPVIANTDYVTFAVAVLQPDAQELDRQAAAQVARLISGAKPANIPVEDPRRYQIVINTGVARQLGVTIPDDVLREATKTLP